MSLTRKGIKYSKEQKRIMSMAHNPNFIKIKDKFTDKLIGIYHTQQEAADAIDVKRTALGNVLTGVNKTMRKYLVKYIKGDYVGR